MNYLITGGRGFIGCHTVRQLQAQGHSVVCIAHNLNNTSMHEVLSEEQIAQLKIVVGSLGDQEFLIRTIKENSIDVIIHLAGVLGTEAEADRLKAVNVNIIGTINIFEAAVKTGVRRVVWGSSQSVFGMEDMYRELYHTELVPNDVLLKPTLVYGATKVFNEFMGEWYYKNCDLETIGLRYTMTFGIARQRGSGQYATNLINNPAEGKKGVVEYSDTAPNWIYVEDAARATILASRCPNPVTRNFTIGGEVKSISELRDYVLTLLPDADIELVPGVFPACYNLDCSAAEKELGYKYEYSAAEGVHTTINIIRAKRGLPPV